MFFNAHFLSFVFRADRCDVLKPSTNKQPLLQHEEEEREEGGRERESVCVCVLLLYIVVVVVALLSLLFCFVCFLVLD